MIRVKNYGYLDIIFISHELDRNGNCSVLLKLQPDNQSEEINHLPGGLITFCEYGIGKGRPAPWRWSFIDPLVSNQAQQDSVRFAKLIGEPTLTLIGKLAKNEGEDIWMLWDAEKKQITLHWFKRKLIRHPASFAIAVAEKLTRWKAVA